MNFYDHQLFHIYNQGNNRQPIFFRKEHYYYFLWKMRANLLPFGDLISYCLMPNHFHWQLYVKKREIEREPFWQYVDDIEFKRRVSKYGIKAQPVDRSGSRVKHSNSSITLNEAIGNLQRAYTRAINRELQQTGSLFRKKCKAKDGWIDEFVSVRQPNGKLNAHFRIGTGYTHHCFKYIHYNPKEAGLVDKITDWSYSSARDYAGLRKGTLCNLELGREMIRTL